MALSPFDAKSLAKLLAEQKKHAWDIEKSIQWRDRVDLSKPLVPLDDDALVFPGAGVEHRLLISQIMGLIIARSIYEMEECLIRLRPQAWDALFEAAPISPEFRAVGEQFFLEEKKHADTFRRYVEVFANSLGVDRPTLESILPEINHTNTEWLLKQSLELGSHVFWWVVATVEQQFLLLHQAMKPFYGTLEPLYAEIHQKHFEEEARHSPFPYLILEVCQESFMTGFSNRMLQKVDVLAAQLVQILWTMSSLSRVQNAVHLRDKHPMFAKISELLPFLEQQPKITTLWKLVTEVPYVSSLINLNAHKKVLRFAERQGAFVLPLPKLKTRKLR